MGRKGAYADKPVKGPGRKAKKQGAPVLKKEFKAEPEKVKAANELSHRQKQRKHKRIQKIAGAKEAAANGTIVAKPKTLKKRAAAAAAVERAANSEDELENYESSDYDSDDEQAGVTVAKPNGRGAKQQAIARSDEDEDDDEQDDDEEDELEEDEDDDDEEENEGDSEDGEEDDDDEIDEDELEANVQKLSEFSGDSNDSEDDDDDDDDDDDAANDDDDDDLLPIEKANKRLRIKKEKDAQLAEEELQETVAHHEVFQFPDETDEAEADKVVTLQDIQQRIKDVSLVLSEFAKYRQQDRSRSEYVELLRKDLCLYYSYNEFLMEKLMDIFPLNDLMEYLEASEVQRPITIRTNSLKTRRRDLAAALIGRGVNLDPLGKWTKIGLVVYSSNVPLGATPEYLAGHYMIQGASSFLPVMALAPQENERVLDMCAAPGGKSSHIAAMMKNTGVLFSNDANKDRIKAVVGNFHRLGVTNSIISHEDGCKFGNIMTGFDRILLDAPCTGTGVVSKDPSVKTTKSETDIQRSYNLQRKLLLAAIDCLSAKSSTGGYLVYSTCSILPEENEWVVEYALRKRNVKLVSTGLDFGTEGFVNYRQFRFHPTMKLTRRYYPHTHNMDGFFVAKLKKFSDAIPAHGADDVEEEEVADAAAATAATDGSADETVAPVKVKPTTEEIAAKKRKRVAEEKKYVAKVFEAAPKTKKPKLADEPTKPTSSVSTKNQNAKDTSKAKTTISSQVPNAKKPVNKTKPVVAGVALAGPKVASKKPQTKIAKAVTVASPQKTSDKRDVKPTKISHASEEKHRSKNGTPSKAAAQKAKKPVSATKPEAKKNASKQRQN